MPSSPGTIYVCGNISYDIPVWPVDKFVWGTTLWVKQITESVGGNGGNTAYTLGKLGTPANLLGAVGLDEKGRTILDLLAQTGVDVSRVRRTSSPTNCSICVIQSTGDRLFLHQPGASADVLPEHLDFTGASPGAHFHLANLYTLPTLRANASAVLERARNAGLTTSLDTGWDASGLWMKDLEPCLPFTGLLFMNDSEARMLTGHEDPALAAQHLRDRGATDVVIKTGPAGCEVFHGSERHSIPAFPVEAVDTTGAGDCFAAGFLAALHRGYSYPEAARLANAVGALNVASLGAVKGILDWDQTLAWISARNRASAI